MRTFSQLFYVQLNSWCSVELLCVFYYILQADVKHVNGDPAPQGLNVVVSVTDSQGRQLPGTVKRTRTDINGAIDVNLDMKGSAGGRIVKVRKTP